MRNINKSALAETFVETMNYYSELYGEFVDTFKLNAVQCLALRKLCDLAEEYSALLAQTDGIITTDEMLKIYYSENTEVTA